MTTAAPRLPEAFRLQFAAEILPQPAVRLRIEREPTSLSLSWTLNRYTILRWRPEYGGFWETQDYRMTLWGARRYARRLRARLEHPEILFVEEA